MWSSTFIDDMGLKVLFLAPERTRQEKRVPTSHASWCERGKGIGLKLEGRDSGIFRPARCASPLDQRLTHVVIEDT